MLVSHFSAHNNKLFRIKTFREVKQDGSGDKLFERFTGNLICEKKFDILKIQRVS